MAEFRTESDLLGACPVPAAALYGVHTVRALENFPVSGRPINRALIQGFGAVKLAAVRTNLELGFFAAAEGAALIAACEELAAGLLNEHIVVDALQGGAGTSTNMNVNEVLANRALQRLGHPLGSYEIISPLEDVNLHQSTNDAYPTALKVAAITRLRQLEREVVALLEAFQAQEKATAHIVKVGRTQMQDAALTTVGREMAAYAEAFGRDRWRIYKCEERLRVVNLGGTAIGTGLGAPRQYIFRVVEQLRAITGLGLARAENLVEATQNADVFVEVSGILKALAVNLMKVSGDLRLLSSGPDAGLGEILLPARQAGSSIMPGKVNPVIPEAVTQAAMVVQGHDQVIAQACALGSLELNPFLPVVADALLDSLDLLEGACGILRRHCVEPLRVDEARCRAQVENATASVTALVEKIGYHQATDLVQQARRQGCGLRAMATASGLISAAEFDELTSPESVTRLGSPVQRKRQ